VTNVSVPHQLQPFRAVRIGICCYSQSFSHDPAVTGGQQRHHHRLGECGGWTKPPPRPVRDCVGMTVARLGYWLAGLVPVDRGNLVPDSNDLAVWRGRRVVRPHPVEMLMSAIPSSGGVMSHAGSGGSGDRLGDGAVVGPRVLISYAHDDQQHQELVRSFWTFLRHHGIDARLDVTAAAERQFWPDWMSEQIRDARFVIVVASPAYRERAEHRADPSEGRGVQWEARQLEELLYRDWAGGSRKIVPVVLPGGQVEDLPDWVLPVGGTTYRLRELTSESADALLRLLTGQPLDTEPPLGQVQPRPPRPIAEQLGPPVRVGLLPTVADQYQDRGIDLDALVRAAGSSSVTLVSIGMGGTGKTQLAAAYAHDLWDQGDVTVLVWVTATSRDAVLSAYAAAAREVPLDLEGRDTEQAAVLLLTWLQGTSRRWLIVLDDLADPKDLDRLWPAGPAGQVLVTTRRRDAMLRTHDRVVLDVDVFTPGQAGDYLRSKLPSNQADDVEGLATDLGWLPLAVAQAAAFIADHDTLTCRSYRARLADRRRTLESVLPAEATADGYASTVAATWSLSIDAANARTPRGVAGRVLELASWLNPNGVPTTVFSTAASSAYLVGGESNRTIGPDDVDDALSNLALFGLIGDAETGSGTVAAIRVHRLVQRATRDSLDEAAPPQVAARAAADALEQAWPTDDHRIDVAGLTALFRANAKSLRENASDQLWSPHAHPVLFRAGRSLTGLPHQAVEYWDALSSTTDSILGPEHPDTLSSRNNLGYAYWEAGRFDDAISAHEATLKVRERILGPDHPDTLTSRSNLASAYRHSGRLDDATRLFETTLAARERILGPEHPDTLQSQNNLALAHGDAGRLDQATRLFEATLAARERILGPEHPDTLTGRNNLASAYRAAGRLEQVIPLLKGTLTDRERVLGTKHPSTLTSRNNLGLAYRDAGRLDASTPLLEATLMARQRILGPEHPDTLTTRNNLAGAYREAGRYAESIGMLEATLNARERILGPEHPDTLVSRNSLALSYRKDGRLDKAVPLMEVTLSDRERILGPEHPDTLVSKDNLGVGYWEEGRLDKAVTLLEATLADRERILGPQHWQTLSSRNHLARSYQSMGRMVEAIQLLEATLADRERVLGPDHPDTDASRKDLAEARSADA